MDLNHIDSKAKRVFVIDQINQLTDKQVSALAELVQDMVNQNIALDTIYK
jgi:FixJ family two-component response regulator